ncbi:MAG: ABC transporter permease subunit [Sporolactobacillus sp.]
MNHFEVFVHIVARAARPTIWDTLRTVWGWAWTYLVVAELVAATSGLGFRIMQAQRYLSTETIILGILTIGVLGLVTDLLFGLLGKLFFPWMEKEKIS